MNREPKVPPLKTWQIMNACVFHLSKEFVVKHYGVSIRQVERWSANPETTEFTARNPIDRYEVLLKKLMEFGHEDVARVAVDRQAQIVGCELAVKRGSTPEKADVIAELLDDYPPLVEFHEAIRNGQPLDLVRFLYNAARIEIEETMEAYERTFRHGSSAAIKEGKGD